MTLFDFLDKHMDWFNANSQGLAVWSILIVGSIGGTLVGIARACAINCARDKQFED